MTSREGGTPRRTLLAVARRAGVPIGYPCRGIGVCGKCTAEIRGGADQLAPPDERERELLDHVGAGPGKRLACLALVCGEGPIELRVGGGIYRIQAGDGGPAGKDGSPPDQPVTLPPVSGRICPLT